MQVFSNTWYFIRGRRFFDPYSVSCFVVGAVSCAVSLCFGVYLLFWSRYSVLPGMIFYSRFYDWHSVSCFVWWTASCFAVSCFCFRNLQFFRCVCFWCAFCECALVFFRVFLFVCLSSHRAPPPPPPPPPPLPPPPPPPPTTTNNYERKKKQNRIGDGGRCIHIIRAAVRSTSRSWTTAGGHVLTYDTYRSRRRTVCVRVQQRSKQTKQDSRSLCYD